MSTIDRGRVDDVWYIQVGALVVGHVVGPSDERLAPLAISDARAEGAVHRRRALPARPDLMGLLELGPTIVAHGGVGGAFIEVGLALAILFIFAAVWIRERRVRSTGGEDDTETTTGDRLFRDEAEDDRRG